MAFKQSRKEKSELSKFWLNQSDVNLIYQAVKAQYETDGEYCWFHLMGKFEDHVER